jgi:16S rRNA (guanine1207-N2)-methyltransferase
MTLPIHLPDQFAGYAKTVTFAGRSYDLLTRPGLPDGGLLTPAGHLLAEHVALDGVERALLFGLGNGLWPVVLGARYPACQLVLRDDHNLALGLTHSSLQANGVTTAQAIWQPYPAHLTPDFPLIAMQLPKGRQLARRWLAEAHARLAPGGVLYLAGANELGVRPLLADAAQLFGDYTLLDFKKGSRLARFRVPTSLSQPPEWLCEKGISPNSWFSYPLYMGGQNLDVYTLPGIFSYQHLDPATALLLPHLGELHGKHVLDFGCGAGVIGLAAALAGAAWVDFTDVDLAALACTRQNLTAAGIPQARLFAGDGLEPVQNEKYDLIATNPPFHAGKPVDLQVTTQFIRDCRELQQPGGSLLLVANRFLPYPALLQASYAHVERVEENGQFTLYRAWK